MGADGSCGCCAGLLKSFRKSNDDGRPDRFLSSFDTLEALERKAEANADAETERILDLVEVKEVHGAAWRRRSSTLRPQEIKEILDYREEFFDCIEFDESEVPAAVVRKVSSVVPENPSDWGKPDTRGGSENSWDEAEATSFQVRGPNFTSDRKKVKSRSALGQLVAVDLFESDVDIAHMSACKAAGIISRIRAFGESRRLFVINFRVNPLHLVIVFALPDASAKDGEAGLALLSRFLDMTDEERNQRLKAIPRVVEGPWVAKRLLGETPGIVGKKIPTEYFVGSNEFEVSFQCTASGIASRIVRVLKPAASGLTIELAFVVQGNTEDELPEQVLGSARIVSPDVSSLRAVDP